MEKGDKKVKSNLSYSADQIKDIIDHGDRRANTTVLDTIAHINASIRHQTYFFFELLFSGKQVNSIKI